MQPVDPRSLPQVPAAVAAAPSSSIAPGAMVTIHGLKAKPELNGTRGEVVKRSKKYPDRFQVRLPHGEIVMLKDGNLAPPEAPCAEPVLQSIPAGALGARQVAVAASEAASTKDDGWSFRDWEEKQRRVEAQHAAERDEIFGRVLKSMLPSTMNEGDAESDEAYQKNMEKITKMTEDLSWMSPAMRSAWLKRAEAKAKREEELEATRARRQEQDALDAQREALRKRFDPDSVDAQGLDPLGDASPRNSREGQLLESLENMQLDEVDAVMNMPHESVTEQVLKAFDVADLRRRIREKQGVSEAVLQQQEDENNAKFSAFLDTVEEEQEKERLNRLALGLEEDESQKTELGEILDILDKAAEESKGKPSALAQGEPRIVQRPAVRQAQQKHQAATRRAPAPRTQSNPLPQVDLPSLRKDGAPRRGKAAAENVAQNQRPSRGGRLDYGKGNESDDDSDDSDDEEFLRNNRAALKSAGGKRSAPQAAATTASAAAAASPNAAGRTYWTSQDMKRRARPRTAEPTTKRAVTVTVHDADADAEDDEFFVAADVPDEEPAAAADGPEEEDEEDYYGPFPEIEQTMEERMERERIVQESLAIYRAQRARESQAK